MSQSDRLYLSPPHMGGEELSYIRQAFDDNWIAPVGEHVDRFEKELARLAGVRAAAALNSGTAAIHLGLDLLGVEAGDRVLCQSFTFAASVNPVRYLGATPVLVDSEPESWNMDPGLLKKAIEDQIRQGYRPKAVIVVHLYGMPARMGEILEIAHDYEIPVLEDAAEAVGSRLDGRTCGGLGDLGVYSFNGNKIITCSGGGALLTNNVEAARRARFLASQAREQAAHYEHREIGYNYRLSNVLAGIGLGQLEVLEERVKARRAHFEAYRDVLVQPGITFPDEPDGTRSNRWLTTLLIDPKQAGGVTREDLRLGLEEKNIESRPLWKPMHLQPVYRDVPRYTNGVSGALFSQGLCLPSGSAMTPDDRNRVTETIRSVLSR
ncbi:MAG: aminotransferase class I/II-fold pyridoxal phosphate-dependent enzyme [Balneolaceae bacterium]